ncbi:MAG TPA: PP2C family serine/threonine-protein phosphatase [Burkholderiales bacterium]|nr:PP2C family serine/threonine-protein phosphatase [Burkholderiales bacterium]
MRFSIVQESRTGKRRHNQDRVGHWKAPEAVLMAVADGMGGHAGGELAAQVAIDFLSGAFRTAARPRILEPGLFLSRTLQGAHVAIVQEGRKVGLGESPRTTLVACIVQAGTAYWSFVGDSRLYVIRDGRILTRTRDHTKIQQLIDAGRMREEAAPAHRERNKLLRCLGGPVACACEPVASAPLAGGDLVLLCSDGLWGPLTPRQLTLALLGKDPVRALPDVTALAEAHGGSDCDNISAVLMQWQENAAPGLRAERR